MIPTRTIGDRLPEQPSVTSGHHVIIMYILYTLVLHKRMTLLAHYICGFLLR